MTHDAYHARTAPAGQATSPEPAPSRPDVRFGPDGRLVGIEPVLDQISQAIVRSAVPAIRDELLPVLQRDKDLQREVGAAAGRAIAHSAPVWLALVGIGVVAGILLSRSARRA